MEEDDFLNDSLLEMMRKQIKEKLLPVNSNNEQQKKLIEITDGVGSIKQQIRQIAQTDAKVAKELLAKMNNLEKLMDDVFPDLSNEIQGINQRIDNLNADFFSTIFRGVLKQELKDFGKSQSEEVKE